MYTYSVQLANHRNKEIPSLLHPWLISAQYTKASMSGRNLVGTNFKIFIGIYISHTTQNHPISIVMIAFLSSEVCYNGQLTAVLKMDHFKEFLIFKPIMNVIAFQLIVFDKYCNCNHNRKSRIVVNGMKYSGDNVFNTSYVCTNTL